MSRNRTLAVKSPVYTLLRIKQPEQGRQNVVYQNQILNVMDSQGKSLDQVKVKNAISTSASLDKLTKQHLSQFTEQIVNGYNLLVMSLGTTGSGKQSLFGGQKKQGIVSLFMEQICMQCQSSYHATNHQNLDFFFEIRGVEIFEERVFDLFNQNLPNTCTLRDDAWQGIVLEHSTVVKAENYLNLVQKLQQAFRNRQNLLNLFSGSTSRTSSFITVSLIQQFKQNGGRATLCSKIMFAELPGLEVLKDSQIDLRARQSHKSIKGIISFSSLIRQLSEDNTEVTPLYQVSNVTYIMKQFLGSNSLCVAIANVNNQNPEGTLKTIACMKNLSRIAQYPIKNRGQSLGLMFRIRTDLMSLKVPQIRQRLSQKAIVDERLMNENSSNDRVKAQDDYKRILIKYREAKTKLQENVKKKSDLQLLLIRSQEQKLQLSKTLVEIQIQNTKLMQDAQFKEYNMSKKNHKLQSAILKNQNQKTRSLQSINDLNQNLQQMQEDKRDLEIQFIALKKNYLLSQKQIEESRKETQRIQLDYINLTNENKYLQEQLFKGTRDQKQKYQLQQLNKYHDQKSEWMQKQNAYKRELQNLRRQLLRSSNKELPKEVSSSKVSQKSSKTQIQNQRLQLYNRQKLNQRKVVELEEHIRILKQDIQQYKEQNANLSQSLNDAAGFYKNKLQQIVKNKDPIVASKSINQHLNSQNQQNSKKITQQHKKVEGLKQSNRALRVYALQLKSLAQQYMPRGLQLPISKPSQIQNIEEAEQSEIIRLNQRIRSLQGQIRSRQPSRTSKSITNERLQQQINFLKQSRVGTPSNNSQAVRKENNQLKQQNRKLTSMLKDNNRLEMAAVLKQNQMLKYEVQRFRSKDSVSPVSNDQKIVYYEKHIKKLQKQRSQLIVRVTMAEQQLKTYQNHFQRKR